MTLNSIAAWTVSGSVAVAVLAGLYLSGSPAGQRLHRLDERRVQDLGTMARAVWKFRQETGSLSADAQALLDGRRLDQLPLDPESGEEYQYVAGAEEYLLCAVFARATPGSTEGMFWAHPAGRHCFKFDATAQRAPGAPSRFPRPPGNPII